MITLKPRKFIANSECDLLAFILLNNSWNSAVELFFKDELAFSQADKIVEAIISKLEQEPELTNIKFEKTYKDNIFCITANRRGNITLLSMEKVIKSYFPEVEFTKTETLDNYTSPNTIKPAADVVAVKKQEFRI